MALWDSLVDLMRLLIFTYAQVCGGNLGSGILLASVTVRIALLPFTLRMAKASTAHQQAMQELQPEMERIRAKYRDRSDRMAEETQKLLKKHDISPLPLAGCLGGVLQLPVFVACYSAVRDTATQGGRFLWIANIARPNLVLTAIVTAITFGTVAYSSSSMPSAQQRQLMLVLPVAITLIALFKTSAGVALYWGVSSAFGLLQAYLVRRSIPAPPAPA